MTYLEGGQTEFENLNSVVTVAASAAPRSVTVSVVVVHQHCSWSIAKGAGVVVFLGKGRFGWVLHGAYSDTHTASPLPSMEGNTVMTQAFLTTFKILQLHTEKNCLFNDIIWDDVYVMDENSIITIKDFLYNL